MNAPKITQQNQNANIRTPEGAAIVKGHHYNLLVDDVAQNESDLDTAEASIATLEGKLLPAGGQQLSANVVEYNTVVAISADEIVGTAAGDLGHADGVPLVAAPGAGYALEFVSAVVIYDYATAAYTGGVGDDLGIRVGTTAVSPTIATADLITSAGDQVVHLRALAAADYDLPVNSTINLKSTAVTNPGTAAGVIRVHLTYRVHTTGL